MSYNAKFVKLENIIRKFENGFLFSVCGFKNYFGVLLFFVVEFVKGNIVTYLPVDLAVGGKILAASVNPRAEKLPFASGFHAELARMFG